MNLIKSLSLLAFATTLSFSQTTMCFKQDHIDLSTLDSVKLDGGLCSSLKSVNDMKKEGWTTSDIKIDGNNYIYIFKKEEAGLTNIDIAAIEAKILSRLEQKEEDSNKKAIIEKRYSMSVSGKNIYINKCQSCHGEKGELKPGFSRAIKDLNLDDFEITIRDYNNGLYDRGTAYSMLPYASLMSKDDIKNIYIYLQSINQKKEAQEN